MTRYIPEVGQGGVPEKAPDIKMAHITVGPATTNDVVVTACGIYTLLSVKEPIVVHAMWTMVSTAFTAGVDLAIGDTGAATRYFVEGTIAATTAGTVLVADTGAAGLPYVYAAAQDINITNDNATAAAGKLHVYVKYHINADYST